MNGGPARPLQRADMLIREKSDIYGWSVEVVCNEFASQGSPSTPPQRCAVWATAKLRPATYWTIERERMALLRYPQNSFVALFDSPHEGRDAAIAELTARIQAFKDE